jgi:hypothetical protein
MSGITKISGRWEMIASASGVVGPFAQQLLVRDRFRAIEADDATGFGDMLVEFGEVDAVGVEQTTIRIAHGDDLEAHAR